MDTEFHYYMTYLIAARAGFKPSEAFIIAQSSQGVDDNHIPLRVSGGATVYENAISQTMDILHPHDDWRIYPVFHFIPGDVHAPTARRKDNVQHVMVTTPNSPTANALIDAALHSRNLYRIGASAHAYVDTWAHQNFAGINDTLNALPLEGADPWQQRKQQAMNLAINIGHGPAAHMPDEPGLTWTDTRLVAEIATVNNKARFLEAADYLFEKLYRFRHQPADDKVLQHEKAALLADLGADIGGPDNDNTSVGQRTQRYQKRALAAAYGATALPTYSDTLWPSAAIIESRGDLVSWLVNTAANSLEFGDMLRSGVRGPCAWKDPLHYQSTDWFKFQEAIKQHLAECWPILTKRVQWLKARG